MNNRARISFHLRGLALSLAVGLLLSGIMLGFILAASDGTEPRGVCAFVAGDAGLLPLNPNEGGTHAYSCDPNVSLAAMYIAIPGMALAVLVHFIPRLLLSLLDPFGRLFVRRRGMETAGPDERRAE